MDYHKLAAQDGDLIVELYAEVDQDRVVRQAERYGDCWVHSADPLSYCRGAGMDNYGCLCPEPFSALNDMPFVAVTAAEFEAAWGQAVALSRHRAGTDHGLGGRVGPEGPGTDVGEPGAAPAGLSQSTDTPRAEGDVAPGGRSTPGQRRAAVDALRAKHGPLPLEELIRRELEAVRAQAHRARGSIVAGRKPGKDTRLPE